MTRKWRAGGRQDKEEKDEPEKKANGWKACHIAQGCHRQLAVLSSRALLIRFHRHELGVGTVGTAGNFENAR